MFPLAPSCCVSRINVDEKSLGHMRENAAIIASLEVTMTFPISSRSTQFQLRAASRLSNSNRCWMLSRPGLCSACTRTRSRRKLALARYLVATSAKYWRFRVSDLNDWLWRQEQAECGRESFDGGMGARVAVCCGGGREELICRVGPLCAGIEMGDFGPEGVCRLVSRLLLGHCFGS